MGKSPKRGEEHPSTELAEDIVGAAFDLVLHAFDNHKEHARFQETQRSWFMLAYLSISGVVWAAVLERLFQTPLPETARYGATIALSFLGFLGVLTGLAITKTGVEFRRHFHCAEAILARMKEEVVSNEMLTRLLAAAMLGTAGDQNVGLRQRTAKSLGVAALHNYLISALIGGETGAIALLWGLTLPWVGGIFAATFLVVTTLFHAYRGVIYSRHG